MHCSALPSDTTYIAWHRIALPCANVMYLAPPQCAALRCMVPHHAALSCTTLYACQSTAVGAGVGLCRPMPMKGNIHMWRQLETSALQYTARKRRAYQGANAGANAAGVLRFPWGGVGTNSDRGRRGEHKSYCFRGVLGGTKALIQMHMLY